MSVCAVGALRSQVCTITSALTWVFAYSANAFTCGASLLTAQQPFSNLNVFVFVLFVFCFFKQSENKTFCYCIMVHQHL